MGIGIARPGLFSSLDSVATGISQIDRTGGAAAIKEAIQLFGRGDSTSFSAVTAQKSQDSTIASTGHIDSPQQFLEQLSHSKNPSCGLFNADGMLKKLQDPAFDQQEGLKGFASKLEENLNSVGDDAQLSNVDLQNVLQKQQQALQMLSNLSKMSADSAMGMIRKLGA